MPRRGRAAGFLRSPGAPASWVQAKTRFEACEQAWDQLYRAGVVVVVEGDDDEDDAPE